MPDYGNFRAASSSRTKRRRRRCAEICVGALLADAVHGEIHLSLYAAEIEHGAPVLLEHSAIAWIQDDEINKYALCPADRELLRRLGKLL